MHKIVIVGLGPGSPDHLTPAALRALRECDVVIGGRRALAAFAAGDLGGVERRALGADNNALVDYLRANRADRRIAVIASGDPGFYSILAVLGGHFTRDELTVIPGIGSLPYFFSRLGISWEGAFMGSLHGREADVAAIVRANSVAAFLTDAAHSYPAVARSLAAAGLGDRMMYAGINLSYEDERIVSDRVSRCAGHDCRESLCVMVIIDE